ncbi:MAG: ZIP family metal transporter [Patescibacteria group bacterium]|jgi:zinc and cadmium transporter
MPQWYLYAITSVIAVGAISLVGIFTLSLQEHVLRKYTFLLISLAIGALLGDAFIHLIPESFEELPMTTAGILVIAGILIFFVLENILHWHHHHSSTSLIMNGSEKEHHDAIHPVGRMILVSDGVHNILDGIIIAVSYLVSIEVGIATTIAVILHEIPQEIGDFGVLLHAGYTKTRALFLNALSAILALVGALAVMVIGETTEPMIMAIVPIAAGGFIYIATADLIPELRDTKSPLRALAQLFMVILGIAAMIALALTE